MTQVSRRNARSAVSPALTPDGIADFTKRLTEFWQSYEFVRQDELTRAQYLVWQCLAVFVSRNIEDGPDGEPIDCVPFLGNLDTGDSSTAPFPAVSAHLAREVVSEHLRHYSVAITDDGLVEAFWGFLARFGFALADQRERLDTIVGYGTVNLYDSLCRYLMTMPGDVLLMPELTYGFFLAQPHRAGGTVATVPFDAAGKIGPAELARVIETTNEALYRRWLPDRAAAVTRVLDELHQRGRIEAAPTADVVSRLVDGLDELSPDDGARELYARAIARYPGLSIGIRVTGHRHPHQILRPPRAVALLHINPGLTGAVYSAAELAALAAVLKARDVSVIEDLAYHSIRLDGPGTHSFQHHLPDTYTLFGLSKPFAVADLRVGLLLAPKIESSSVNHLIDTSVGFVSGALQRTMAACLGADRDELAAYLDEVSGGYEFRRALMTAMLEGIGSARVDPAVRPEVERVLRAGAAGFFREKFRHGIVLTDTALDPGGDRYEDLPAAVLDEHARLVDAFVGEGLARWFEIEVVPTAGFFQIVSCRRLLARNPVEAAGIELRTAFDVFAFLAYFLGVRSIPEEGMGLPRPDTTRLRFSFSPEVSTLVTTLFTTYLALSGLDR
ncbi:aminotransferase class I/II-fold pyridoxal phosphate-dependent enzyme [Actinokineospora sp.]|uniref:aminotransferase class I/II-fold pyridoxal phosphate-dependent enzyme n=1 Tax=Actinokineospora sp. TaxID=1872133 RepID=UPI004037F3AD